MPSFCTVLNCNDKYGHGETTSFHKYPLRRKGLMQQWLAFAGRDSDWKPSRWSCICSRHFRSDDFSGLNERRTLKKTAVPTVRDWVCADDGEAALAPRKPLPTMEEVEPLGAVVVESKKTSNNVPKGICRLCGGASAHTYVSFLANFEIYGMIQKCFPTLNIQQHDNLSKEMCSVCLQRLESFSRFIDIVLGTQRELQRKYDAEKQSATSKGTTTTTERQLKIKQEPVVRVKQEVFEGFDSFLTDEIDMSVDDGCCEQEHSNAVAGINEVDQKCQLFDLPAMLNAQDIINDCDIMEIINLEDAFIDIPDDDGNTTIDEPVGAKEQRPQQQRKMQPDSHLRSAYELLQTHLLLEEHNYAGVEENFKEEWQMKNNWKTEKSDEYDDDADAESDDYQPCNAFATTPHDKPIVTSVAAVANHARHRDGDAATVSSTTDGSKRTHTKPNIVVLDESIVQSSSAFKLHKCTECQLNFFSIETLRTHAWQQHNMLLPAADNYSDMVSAPQLIRPPPMVHMPHNRAPPPPPLPPPLPMSQLWPSNNCKREKGQDTVSWTPMTAVEQLPPNRVNILEMESLTSTFGQPPQSAVAQTYNPYTPIAQLPPPTAPATSAAPHQPEPVSKSHAVATVAAPPETEPHPKIQLIVNNYNRLQRRYRQLQRKCRHLQAARQPALQCRICRRKFARITQLLHHKQKELHFVQKPRTHFAATCAGCERFFQSRLALRNHMRYICTMLPLRQRQVLTFKCRHCCSITFTHWRLYRRHELKCRTRLEQVAKRRHQLPPATPKRMRAAPNGVAPMRPGRPKACHQSVFKCLDCAKTFTSSKSLNQHSISHNPVRRHKCTLCTREFKRRHGLTQHLRGYHLQLKPYTCSICQHSYSLKCDMQRCRHSVLASARASGAIATPSSTSKRQEDAT